MHRTATTEDLLAVHRRATRIHRVDERMISMLKSGKIAATYYSPRGQEIVSAAMSVHLDSEDYLVTTYRGMHDQLAKGVPLNLFFAEYAGKTSGACKGKGGPMHITHPASGVMVTTGIVAAGLPIANGLALASKLRRDGRVTVCNFGDGASNHGAFHEALNMASLWKLPVVFLCQNNRYAEHTAFRDGTAAQNISSRAAAYSMATLSVNGNDAAEMWAAAEEAVGRARRGEGPTLLEAHTFRFRGHNFGDSGHYIPKEEYAQALAEDPVPILRRQLLAAGVSEQALGDIDATIEQEIDAALRFAFEGAAPQPADLYDDVYAAEVAA